MAITGYGTTVSFDSGFFAEIRNVDGPEMSRSKIDTSHSTTVGGFKTFIFSDLRENGEVSISGIADPSSVPPIDEDLEPCVITYQDGTTWSFSGGLMNYKITAPHDDLVTFTATLVVSGEITIA